MLSEWLSWRILTNSAISQSFFPVGEHLSNVYKLISRTTNCQLYSNISQILLLYKLLAYYNKFDSMKSIGVYYWYVKMSRCGYVEHGLDYFSFHVKKNIWLPVLDPLLVRNGPLGAPAFLDSLIAISVCTLKPVFDPQISLAKLQSRQTRGLWFFKSQIFSQGLYSLKRRRLTGIGIPIINLRRSDDRLRFIMGTPILIRRRLLSE